jgi:FixJ family two-component response regulator
MKARKKKRRRNPGRSEQDSTVSTQPETIICVLDDDASVLKAMRRLLRSAGFETLGFNEAQAFLKHAETNAISLAILDIWMPDINGLEVQRRLLEVAPTTPVIIMTGRDTPVMRSLAVAQGAVAFFAKPFADEALLRTIRAALPAST